MADTFAQFDRKLVALQRDVDDRRTLNTIGQGAKADTAEAVNQTLGDNSLSNWWVGRPIPIVARYDVRPDSTVEVGPTRRSVGPLTVLERGRRAGVSSRRGTKGRRYGASAGKGAWTKAVQLMEKNTPKRVHDQLVKALRRQF